jgi:hypothetical protein
MSPDSERLGAFVPKAAQFTTTHWSDVSLKHFLANEWKRSQTQKRGGGRWFIPLDHALAEDLYRREPADTPTAETI